MTVVAIARCGSSAARVEIEGEDREEMVAVDDPPVRVDGDDTVRVPVEREPDVGAAP